MSPESSIGPYRILRPLGRGGMGDVALAYDPRLKRNVALKSVASREAPPDTRARLIYEARAAAGLSHPGIAAIYDVIEDEDRAVIVMEYVEGRTLASKLASGRLTSEETNRLAHALCDAVGAAHAQRVVHRDLKPANIMLTADGRPKILDFGLARRLHAPTDTTDTGLGPASRGIVGTVGYIAPEQIRGTGIDHRCDIYALGTIFFEAFTGRRPFLERDPLGYAIAVTTQDAPRADAIDPTIDSGIADVLARALARDENRRYQSTAELAADLDAAMERGSTITVQRRPVRRRTVRWFPAAVAATAILVTALVGWPLLLRRSESGPVTPQTLAILPALSVGAENTSIEAAGLTAILASNLGHLRDLDVRTVAEAAITAAPADVARVLARAKTNWGLQATIRRDNGFSIDALLFQAAPPAVVWQQSFSGDALTAQQQMLAALPRGLEEARLVRRLSADEMTRASAWPTKSADAFREYAEGRLRLAAVSDPSGADAAVRLFTSAIGRDDRFALAHAALSDAYWVLYLRSKDATLVEKATSAARRALTLDPTQAAVHISLATMHFQTGRFDDAQQAADRAIELQPNNANAYRLRGRVLAQSGKIDEALVALDRAIELRPDEVTHHESKGFVLYRAARYKDAAEAYKRVTQLAPDYAQGFMMLGTALHQLGDTTQAIGNYEHAVRVGPSALAYSNLAFSYYEVGRYEDALKAYLESVTRDRTRPMGHRNLADVYAKLGRQREARASYAAAIAAGNALLAVNPTDAETISLIALCEARLGQGEAAERHAAEAFALRPSNRDIAVRTAEVYAILRQLNRSMDALKAALALGYPAQQARANEALINLREVPDFRSLISVTDSTKGRQ